MPSIIHLLLDFINSESQNSVNCLIAKYLLSHINDMEKLSVSRIAMECNVSKATVSRFCKKIGLHDFYEFKFMYHNNKSDTLTKYCPLVINIEDYTDNYISTIIQSLTNFKQNINKQELLNIAHDIMKYDKVGIFGHLQSGKIATSLQTLLFSNNKLVYSATAFQDQKEYILNSTDKDLIIIFSTSGRYFDRMFSRNEFLKKKNKPKIYMITNLNKPIKSQYTEHIIYVPSNNLLSTSVMLQCYADLISLTYFQLYFSK